MEKYLSGEEPNFEALHAPFEKALDEGHLIPVLFTDAKTGSRSEVRDPRLNEAALQAAQDEVFRLMGWE